MNIKEVKKILRDTDFVHTSGTEQELKVANILKAEAEKIGADVHLEEFPVAMGTMKEAHLYADGQEITSKGYLLCGSGEIEAPFCYLPNTDETSLLSIKGKIVMPDTGIGIFLYKDLLKYGAAGFITYNGNINYPDKDIDEKELRPFVSNGEKMLGVNIHASDAVKLVKNKTQNIKIVIDSEESEGVSHNVVAEIPGYTDEWITFTAHYDTTPLSRGSYDNMTGCIGLLGIMEHLKKTAPHRYGARFIFCGSEERGLLGSKAYTAQHEAELEKIAMCINLDMIGTIMGRFIACCTSENKLVDYITYIAAEQGWGITARQGVYSSDSTPFADKGVPAVSFARLAGANVSNIHSRYDTTALLSPEQILKDIDFIADFSERMVSAVKCPVSKTIPDNVKADLDEYLGRKRKK